jgi:hypothetical protein
MELTGKEKFQIQYLLPVQGTLKALELVEGILKTINLQPEDSEDEKLYSVALTPAEIDFLNEMIGVLDQAGKLSLQMLPVVRKILNNKERGNEPS